MKDYFQSLIGILDDNKDVLGEGDYLEAVDLLYKIYKGFGFSEPDSPMSIGNLLIPDHTRQIQIPTWQLDYFFNLGHLGDDEEE